MPLPTTHILGGQQATLRRILVITLAIMAAFAVLSLFLHYPNKDEDPELKALETATSPAELRAALSRAEENAPPEVKTSIGYLRGGNALGEAKTAEWLRARAGYAFGAIEALIEQLGDDTPLYWKRGQEIVDGTSPAGEAALTLGRIGKPAVKPLIEALKESSGIGLSAGADRFECYPFMRKRDLTRIENGVVEALGEAGDRSSEGLLIEVLARGKPDIDERMNWARALRKIDPEWWLRPDAKATWKPSR
jgi:hypothetical protein